jgi:hypothetical protein
MELPILIKPVPTQMVYEGGIYGPVDLKEFIKVDPESGDLRFHAELKDGSALPIGIICTNDGVLTGIPAQGTAGVYDIHLIVANAGGSLQVDVVLVIKPNLANAGSDYFTELKNDIWQAINQSLPIPDLAELYNKPITQMEIYYLLERWASLTLWDAYNLDPMSEKQSLLLEDASPHYLVYDRGTSCIVATPKDLFSYERTLADSIQTARAMAREVYRRGWAINMAGFDKMEQAVWVELQHLGAEHGKYLEVLNFDPTIHEFLVYGSESSGRSQSLHKK